jgi:tRNA threonylcarbamoyladenosine biosynthesis protein TsaB
VIILLDTSTPVCRLRVVDGDESTDYEWEAGRTLARGLLGFLQEKTGDITHISGIGVMKGPGSFTGLRIGLAVVNTLADGLSVPIVGETGDSWRESALGRLSSGEDDQVILPFYGGDAHITKPKK